MAASRKVNSRLLHNLMASAKVLGLSVRHLGGVQSRRAARECVPIHLDLGVSESRAEHRKINTGIILAHFLAHLAPLPSVRLLRRSPQALQ